MFRPINLKRFSTTKLILQTKQVQLSDFSLLKDTKFNRVKSVRNTGFVVEDVEITGPMIIFNSQILLWNVPQYGVGGPKGDVEPLEPNAWNDPNSPFYGWTEDMFSLFKYVDHKPELLLIGTGGKVSPFPTKIAEFLNRLGIQTEISNSKQAGNIYNEMIQEGRFVALAALPLIPTSPVDGKILVELLK